MSTPSQRMRELDVLRGIAIVLMVLFHLIYDLNAFYDVPIDYKNGLIFYMGKIAASMFIIIAGVSCTLSKSNFKRGLYVLFWALVVTVATSVAVSGSNIVFGILHFLGISIVISPLFRRFDPHILFIMGTIILVLGPFFREITLSHNFLLPFGLMGKGFSSADYYPLFPWFGLFLYGNSIGKFIYSKNWRPSLLSPSGKNLLDISGRHSLTIYLAHQPILLAVLYLVFVVV